MSPQELLPGPPLFQNMAPASVPSTWGADGSAAACWGSTSSSAGSAGSGDSVDLRARLQKLSREVALLEGMLQGPPERDA